MTSSICSQMSQMSVSFCGEEMELEAALDKCFHDLQASLNQCHCSCRELAMSDDQGLTLEEVLEIAGQIDDYTAGMTNLFKELMKVVKQIIKPADVSEKLVYKIWMEKRKEAKAASKSNQSV